MTKTPKVMYAAVIGVTALAAAQLHVLGPSAAEEAGLDRIRAGIGRIYTADGEVLDMLLNVYDLEDTLLISNDDLGDSGAGSGFEELEIPFDLTMVLEVTTYGDLEEGTYTLTVEQN